MLGELDWMQGHHDAAFERFYGAVELVRDAPVSRSKVYVESNLARFLTNADRAEEAIRVGFDAFQMAEELGLDDLRAHTLTSIGFSRVMIGDRGGLVDLERSIAIAQEANSPVAIRGCNNLASMLADLGDLSRAFELYVAAGREAERFGDGRALRWLAVERMHECYWRGRWDEALRIGGEINADAGSPSIRDVDVLLVRARIRMARDGVSEGVADARAALELARQAKEPQMLFPALALSGRVLLLADRSEEAETLATELLRRWGGSGATLPSFWIADLAPVLAALDRGDDLIEAAQTVSAATRWLDAALAYVGGDLRQAAQLYAQIGSLPDQAFARLAAAKMLIAADRRSEAEPELARSLEFYRRVRADAQVREGETLLPTTA
jgi:tetratricopeptide (TPR) repeat protein